LFAGNIQLVQEGVDTDRKTEAYGNPATVSGPEPASVF